LAQIRTYNPTWIGVWRDDNNTYYGGGSPIRVGGGQGFNTYIGFPSQIRTDINNSSTPVTLRMSIYIYDAGTFSFGAHKRTSNPASSGLPWYEYIGISQGFSTGRKKIDITSEFKNRFVNEGFEGIVLYGSVGGAAGAAYGLTGNAYRAVIEVEGQWNSPPTAPTITYPNGGETLSGQVTLRANPATDPDEPQSKLRYQWGIWDGTWHYLPLSNPGVTDVTVDLSKYKETSTAKVALRAFDSYIDYGHGNYGPWDYSNGVFTIRHNVPPSSPTNLHPSGGETIDRTEIISLSWKHNDAGPQSRYTLRWRLRGTTSWNTVTKDSVDQRHYLAANALPVGTIEWQVMTYDQEQLASPYSSIALLTAADPTEKPIIISPAFDESITIANPVLEWSSIDQVEYEYEVLNGNTVLYSSNEISTNKAITLPYELQNNTDYTIRIRVKASTGLWSDWATVDIHTSFTPPVMPLLEYEVDPDRGSISIMIDNPYPQGDEPSVKINQVYRRELGANDWELIGDYIPVNATFTDYHPASNKMYEYKVIAYGVNGTSAESTPITASVTINNVIISVLSNPDQYIHLVYNPSKKFTHGVQQAINEYQGRAYPLVEFGTGRSLDLDLSFTVKGYANIDILLSIIEARQTLVYRDRRGRKEFITIPSINVTDKNVDKYDVSFSPVRVYYKEDLS
jgi:hypothetical protein